MNMITADEKAGWQIIKNTSFQVRLRLKPKRISFLLTQGDKNSTAVKNGDKNIQEFDTIRDRCDQFEWSVQNNDSHIFTFTTYKNWNKVVCLLSDTDLNSTYEYVCQYGL